MAVIGFVLRDDDHVGGRNIGQMVDTRGNGAFRKSELGMEDGGIAG